VVPFDTAAYEAKVDPQDTILSLAERLAKYGGGGTDCSLPLVQANGKYAKRQFAGGPNWEPPVRATILWISASWTCRNGTVDLTWTPVSTSP
jgi:hypothetical protein